MNCFALSVGLGIGADGDSGSAFACLGGTDDHAIIE